MASFCTEDESARCCDQACVGELTSYTVHETLVQSSLRQERVHAASLKQGSHTNSFVVIQNLAWLSDNTIISGRRLRPDMST